jgi:hypothetical protein
VKKACVQGQWLELDRRTLVDAPGLHNDNAARNATVRGFMAQATSIWLVANITRATNDKTTKDMLTLSLRKWLCENGQLGEVVLVTTQSDVLVRSEIVTNLRLRETATARECVLARNAFLKKTLTRDFFEGIDMVKSTNTHTHMHTLKYIHTDTHMDAHRSNCL